MKLLLYFTLFICFASKALAMHEFYNDHKRGWFWFEDMNQSNIQEPIEMTTEYANTLIEKTKKELDDARSVALVNPTPETVAAYKRLEQKMWQTVMKVYKASEMAKFIYPSLVSNDTDPTNVQGVRIKRQIEEDETNAQILKFSKDFEFVIFRSSSCKYCQGFEPILAEFARSYGFQVEAVSVDDKASEFFKTKNNSNLANTLNITAFPTVIAVHKSKPIIFEFVRGMVSFSQLQQQATLAVKYLKEQNYE